MRWHGEILLEALLVGIILWRKPQLRWFESWIGVDLAANLLQLLTYREDYRGIARMVWAGGIALACPLGLMAIIEAGKRLERSAAGIWHLRILACYFAATLLCVSLQTQPDWVIPVNHALLVIDSGVFLAWSAMFILM